MIPRIDKPLHNEIHGSGMRRRPLTPHPMLLSGPDRTRQ